MNGAFRLSKAKKYVILQKIATRIVNFGVDSECHKTPIFKEKTKVTFCSALKGFIYVK